MHSAMQGEAGRGAAECIGHGNIPYLLLIQYPMCPVLQNCCLVRPFCREKLDKERLKALGMGAFASYGVISNLNYGTALT